MTKSLTHEQRLAEARQRVRLERHLADQGVPEGARDHFLNEMTGTELIRSYLNGAPEPSIDELVQSVYATERGKLLREILDEAEQLDAAPKATARDEQLRRLADLPPAARMTEARRLGIA
ncbi:hypothetical protein [Roseivivax sp. THAF197b]|uniref:hypothetical protein n=1 Tax=Roseivivax sp. THAF197b TaxID=2588299 RepID=UPI0012695F7A|nr:hypothetical protein [Roseivivax sp. THAF197b]QFS83679.1 hypothetical protein FIV09_12650 [Roseivivax sp. THAF197b]